MKKERLVSVEIWDVVTNDWQSRTCPKGCTVAEYADWCVNEDFNYLATVNTPEDKIRLNGKYVIDGSDYFFRRMKM